MEMRHIRCDRVSLSLVGVYRFTWYSGCMFGVKGCLGHYLRNQNPVNLCYKYNAWQHGGNHQAMVSHREALCGVVPSSMLELPGESKAITQRLATLAGSPSSLQRDVTWGA